MKISTQAWTYKVYKLGCRVCPPQTDRPRLLDQFMPRALLGLNMVSLASCGIFTGAIGVYCMVFSLISSIS